MAILAALALALVAIAPALAAPSSTTGGKTALTDHTTDCNVTFDAEGNLLLDGAALAGAGLAAVEALLAANADLAAALDAAADAEAEACVELVLDAGAGGITAVINADISFCPATVEVNADGDLVLDGHVFAADLLDSELAALVEAAATADVDLICALIEVTDNGVAARVLLEVCATVTLDSEDQVTIELGGVEFLLEADAVLGADAELEVGATAEAGVALTATVDFESDTLAVRAVLVDLEGCGEDDAGGGGGPTASPVPTIGAMPAPGTGQLPDTGVQPESTAASSAASVALVSLLVLGAATYAAFVRRHR